jgi:rubrerythrin
MRCPECDLHMVEEPIMQDIYGIDQIEESIEVGTLYRCKICGYEHEELDEEEDCEIDYELFNE